MRVNVFELIRDAIFQWPEVINPGIGGKLVHSRNRCLASIGPIRLTRQPEYAE